MKEKHIKAYMLTAKVWAECSTATKLKVGAVIAKDDQILSVGYNGTPNNWDNICEDKEWCTAGGWLSIEEIEEGWPYQGTYLDANGNEMQGRYRLKTKPEVLHAESNALMKIAKNLGGAEGATVFCTHSPCLECAKLIYQSGIKEVFYNQDYRSKEGIYFLKKANINVVKFNI